MCAVTTNDLDEIGQIDIFMWEIFLYFAKETKTSFIFLNSEFSRGKQEKNEKKREEFFLRSFTHFKKIKIAVINLFIAAS
jgi:hypothetical protein